jgi:hypothetical protein
MKRMKKMRSFDLMMRRRTMKRMIEMSAVPIPYVCPYA